MEAVLLVVFIGFLGFVIVKGLLSGGDGITRDDSGNPWPPAPVQPESVQETKQEPTPKILPKYDTWPWWQYVLCAIVPPLGWFAVLHHLMFDKKQTETRSKEIKEGYLKELKGNLAGFGLMLGFGLVFTAIVAAILLFLIILVAVFSSPVHGLYLSPGAILLY